MSLRRDPVRVEECTLYSVRIRWKHYFRCPPPLFPSPDLLAFTGVRRLSVDVPMYRTR